MANEYGEQVGDKVKLRPAVETFAVAMERMLRENERKGGWDGNIDEFLKAKVTEETAEMFMAHVEGDMIQAAKEAVDLANFCMMLWTRWLELPEEYHE